MPGLEVLARICLGEALCSCVDSSKIMLTRLAYQAQGARNMAQPGRLLLEESSIRMREMRHAFLQSIFALLRRTSLARLCHPRRPRMRAHKPHPPTRSVPLCRCPHGVGTLRAHRRPECTGQHPQIRPQMERRAGKRGDILQRAVHGPRIANLSTFFA
jgi:hypothetical protein